MDYGTKEETKPLVSSAASRKSITVEPSLVLFFVAVTAANPMNQQYLHNRFAEDFNYTAPRQDNGSLCGVSEGTSRDDDPLEKKVQAAASFWTILFLAADLLPALVTTVLLGAYSDKAGRKKAMVPPVIESIVRASGTLLVVAFRLPLFIIVVAALIDGCLGGTFTFMMASLAYMADVTTPKQRPLRILAVEIFSGLGQTAAYIGVGYLLKALGFTVPYLILLAINTVNLLYVLLCIEETTPKNPEAKLFDCANFLRGIEVISKRTEENRRWKIVSGLSIFLIISILDFGAVEIITFYVLNPPFCWSSVVIGYFHSFAYLVQTIGSLVFLKLFYRCAGEYGLVLISCISGIGYYVMLALARTTLMIFLGEEKNTRHIYIRGEQSWCDIFKYEIKEHNCSFSGQ